MRDMPPHLGGAPASVVAMNSKRLVSTLTTCFSKCVKENKWEAGAESVTEASLKKGDQDKPLSTHCMPRPNRRSSCGGTRCPGRRNHTHRGPALEELGVLEELKGLMVSVARMY